MKNSKPSKWTKCECGKFILREKYTQCFPCYNEKQKSKPTIKDVFTQGKDKIKINID